MKKIGKCKKYRYIKLFTTERKRNYVVSKAEFFTKSLLETEMRNSEILINNSVYLGFLMLELSNILMYQFCYEYIKLNIVKKPNVIVYIKTEDIYKDFAKDVERRFDTSNYELQCNSIERQYQK